MKLIRQLALMVVMVAFPTLVLQAQGQQEVDPDHFEQSAHANAQGLKAQGGHQAASAKSASYRGHARVRTASKQSGKSNHRRARVSA